MSQEFEDLVYRVPSEQVKDFVRRNARGFPRAKLISGQKLTNLVDEKAIYETLSWDEELAKLKTLIDKVQEAVETKNPVAVSGFNRLYDKRSGYAVRDDDYIGGAEGFRNKAIDIFTESLEAYGDFIERPGHPEPRTGRAFIYTHILNFLTPRDIRSLTDIFGLTGTVIDIDEVAVREGIAAGSQAKDTALNHLMNIFRYKATQTQK
jgi:hypothetical protein